MSPPLRLAAPAKTNLFLEVPRRRADGFHELDTVFVALELADALELEAAGDAELRLELAGAPEAPAGPENLVWRAAHALRRAAGRPELGARIRLEKRIPSGGGLGGGSSDAAAALTGLDRLWGTGLPPERLEALAADLGSDVAFFVRGGVQRGRGRGEELEPVPPPPRPLALVLLLPGFPCPTPAVYRALAPHLPATPRSAEPLLRALATGDPRAVAPELFNRLEAPARERFPRLSELSADLAAAPGVLGALLSGSGSTLVGLAEDDDAAASAAAVLRAAGHEALATRTVGGAGG